MERAEAERLTNEIHDHIGSIRQKLIRMQDEGGYLALGYKSMHVYMLAEFRLGKSQMYRELEAGNIERLIAPDSPIGEKPESHMRELATLNNPVLMIAAAQVAEDIARVTKEPIKAGHYRAAADTVKEAVLTAGHVTIGGESVSVLTASAVERYNETLQRQSTHIKSALPPPIFDETGLPEELLPKLKDRLISVSSGGDSVRILVYTVKGK